jgi:predicted metal-dependent hydrolase
MDIQHIAWPPAYNLRISKKARNVHLKIIPNRGLEIVVPVRHQKRVDIAGLLEEKKSWIEKHLATVIIRPPALITELTLNAIQQTWQIEYQTTNSRQIRAIERPLNANTHSLILYGNVNDIPKTHKWIKTWLKQIAQTHLLPWLDRLSQISGLPYNQAAIRGQQTLWGSCNSQKNINLNYKLLFVPAILAEHIMLHELCHTKHLNHGVRFWRLLRSLDPNCDHNNQQMRQADKLVPFWGD